MANLEKSEPHGLTEADWIYLSYNSYVSRRLLLHYVSTPKAACTALKWWFAELDAPEFFEYDCLRSHESDPQLVVHDCFHLASPATTGLSRLALGKILSSQDFFRFALVRNPFTRMFSAWQSKIFLREPQQADRYATTEFYNQEIRSIDDIARNIQTFLEYLCAEEWPNITDPHWAPQNEVLRLEKLSYSLIAKVEQPEGLWKNLADLIGEEKFKAPPRHKYNESMISYSPKFFTDRSVELIRKLYATDFTAFEYPLTPPIEMQAIGQPQIDIAVKAMGLIRGRNRRFMDVRTALDFSDMTTAKLQQEVAERDQDVARLNAALREREDRCAEIEQQVAEAQVAASNLAATIGDQNEQIRKMRQEIAAFSQAVDRLESLNTENHAASAALQSQMELRDRTISELRDHHAVALHGKREIERRTAELEEKLRKISRSASWLITRPLREVGRWGRRLRRLTRPVRRALTGKTTTPTSGTGDQASATGLSNQNGSAIVWTIRAIRRKTRPIRYLIMGKTMPMRTPPAVSQSAQKSLVEAPPHIPGFSPLVSVIVPNYNHERYLRSRLDSIYNQSYQNIEVILLDDASTDGSLAVLSEYAERHGGKTRLIKNMCNSGSPFAQWQKGMDLARGELIWIAESDDESTPQFLSELAPMFANAALTLAFCKTNFIDDAGKVVWSTDEYLHDVTPELWQRPFSMGAARLVQRAWISKNIVPNVGSAVFRKPRDLSKLRSFGWTNFKVCGDWIFYLNACRGGLVGYSEKPMNLYRLHAGNTSVNLHKDERFYREHAEVLRFAQLYYHISGDDCQRHMDTVSALWRLNRPQEPLDFIYNTYRDLMTPKRHRLNIMICGFALTSGGGETFPIILANGLRAMDCNVTFCNFNREPTIEAVRKRLRSDVPLVEITDPVQLPQFVDDLKIDVIHTHHAWVDVAVADLLQTNTRCALVCSTHGMYDSMDSAEIHRIVSLLEKRVDRFCYAAEKNLSNFPHEFLFEKRFANIPNATEIRSVSSVSRGDLGISDSAFVVCLISRAIPEKGWAEAIVACSMARKSTGRDIQLLLVGNGPEAERLVATGTEDFVHTLGFRNDVLELFTLADVGLLPTRFSGESFPLILLDCLAAERPMIATDVGEIRRIMSDHAGPAGVLIALENGQVPVKELADAISRLGCDATLLRELRMRTVALKNKFSVPSVAKGYLSAYIDAFLGRNPNSDRYILDNDCLADAH